MRASLLATVGVILSVIGANAQAATINLTGTGTDPVTSAFATAVVGGANAVQFIQGEIQPAGSGNLDSFLRIQATGSEMGFNVPVDVKAPLDGKDGSFTRTLDLSTIPTRQIVVGGELYREFLLDLNENIAGDETNPDRYISLNQVQIFLSSAPLSPIPAYSFVDSPPSGSGTEDLPPVIQFSGSPTMTEIFRLNNTGAGFTEVWLNAALSSGSGQADMTLLVRDSLFDTTKGTFVTLFSQFGHEPGLYPSEATYEEWAVRAPAVVPEPSTFALGIGALGLLGLAGLRRRRLA